MYFLFVYFGRGVAGGRCFWVCLACTWSNIWDILALLASGSGCLLWKLSYIAKEKNKNSNVAGKRAGKFILLICIQCADFRTCMWAFSHRNKEDPHCFFCSSPSLIYKLGWPESNRQLSSLWQVKWETGRDFSTSHGSDQAGLVPNLPVIKWGLREFQLF